MLERVADELAGFGELGLVGTVPRHRLRQAVRREKQLRVGPPLGGNLIERGLDAIARGCDESGMIETYAQPIDDRRAGFRRSRLVEILAILAAAVVRAERARHVSDGPPHAVFRHLRERISATW